MGGKARSSLRPTPSMRKKASAKTRPAKTSVFAYTAADAVSTNALRRQQQRTLLIKLVDGKGNDVDNRGTIP